MEEWDLFVQLEGYQLGGAHMRGTIIRGQPENLLIVRVGLLELQLMRLHERLLWAFGAALLLVALVLALGHHDKIPEQRSSKQEYLNAAAARMTVQDFAGAVRYFDAAIEMDPEDWALWNGRGMARRGTLDYQGALQDFDKAIALNPSVGRLHNNRGVVRAEAGNYQEAVLDFNRAVDFEPSQASARVNRAQVRARVGDWEGAIGDYERGLLLLPATEFEEVRTLLHGYYLGAQKRRIPLSPPWCFILY